MAKRFSSLFSSKDDNGHSRSKSPARLDPTASSIVERPQGKLTKSRSDLQLSTRTAADFDPPPAMTDTGVAQRPMSRDGRFGTRVDTTGSRNSSGSRPQTPTMLGVPGTASPIAEHSPGSAKVPKRRSWIPAKGEKGTAEKNPDPSSAHTLGARAWIAGLRELVPYDISPLLAGERVADLWNEDGDVLVHLYPEQLNRGPSFRVSSELFVDSRALSYLAQPAQANGHERIPSINLEPTSPIDRLSLNDNFGSLYSESGNVHVPGSSRVPTQHVKSVHLPLGLEGNLAAPGAVPTGDDLELIVLYRNFFAFLCGGALVATPRQNNLYAIFMGVSSILRRLQYGNEKGSSWGAVPWASFSRYTDELRLADVRSSREKNIEAIVLGEAMKSYPLYIEGFAHAVGRLSDIKAIQSPKFDKISPVTINKMERAHMDLEQRIQVLRSKLDNFYFPSMFSGIANSQTATEAKLVRFKAWKAAFMDFRSHTIAFYKKKYGNWPPKASSKKNDFEESGLNRQLLRQVYQDFTDLYELLVDRTSMTPRSTDLPSLADDAESGSNETTQHAIRRVESEHDRSTPPVLPPIPFDVPLIPTFGNSLNKDHLMAKDSQNPARLKENALSDLLMGASNRDSIKSSPWIQAFMDYERKLGQNKMLRELVDARAGQWLFVYAVLQAMPMTVVDARDLQYTEGVEYFLCEAPRGGRPWLKEDTSTSRAWYNVASGGGLVSLPADLIDHSVEGIYRRSFCWTVANKWAEQLGPMSPTQTMAPQFPAPASTGSPYVAANAGSAAPSPFGSPLLQPIRPFTDDLGSGLPRVSSRTSMHLGLQEVAAPEAPSSRPTSAFNPNLTFDNILTSNQIPQKSGKKSKK